MSETTIKCRKDGPLLVSGDFSLTDAEGGVYGLAGRTTIALCRCGLSGNKPFCDGSHKGKFSSEVTACQLPPPAPKG